LAASNLQVGSQQSAVSSLKTGNWRLETED
jgi:hypothetical protein